MKKILIILLLIFPLFCLSQKEIITLKSNTYSINSGGTITNNKHRNTKILIKEDKIIFSYRDQLIRKKLPLKDMKIDKNGDSFYVFAKINRGKNDRYITLFINDKEKTLNVEYKKYIKIFNIRKYKILTPK